MKRKPWFAAGIAIGLVAMAGAYALAATTATHWAGTFATEESERHARMGEFQEVLKHDVSFARLAARP